MKKSIAVFMLLILALINLSGHAEEIETVEVNNSRIFYDITGNARGVSLNPIQTGFLYSDTMLLGDSKALSTDLAKASVSLAMAAYEPAYIVPMFEDMGYTAETYDYDVRSTVSDNDRVAYTIAYKLVPSENKVIICTAVRGTYGNAEWFSNFNIGEKNNGNHLGFYTAKKTVATKLNSVISSCKKKFGLSNSDVILWFTGHSRGAAVANILSGEYTADSAYGASHVFGYTYACPAVSKNAKTSYTNIYNFNTTGDLIASVPLMDAEWGGGSGYKRYGKDITNHPASDENIARQFKKMANHDYAGAADTIAYEQILKVIAPSEEKVNDPLQYFGMNLVAYVMGGKNACSFPEFVGYFGSKIAIKLLFERLKAAVSLQDAYGKASTFFEDLENLQSMIEKARETTKDYSEVEFKLWLLDNSLLITEIFEYTGVMVTEYAHLGGALGFILQNAPVATNVGKVIGCVMDLCDSSGNVLQAIPDAHSTGAYLSWINSQYFGYRGWSGTQAETIVLTRNIRTIGSECFIHASDLTTVFTNKLDLDAVGAGAFSGCYNLCDDLLFEEGMRYIGERAFYECRRIEKLNIPRTVTKLGGDHKDYEYGAFYECYRLKDVTLPVELSDTVNFHHCSDVEVIHYTLGSTGVMPDRTKGSTSGDYIYTAYTYTMENCSHGKLREVYFEEGITHIGDYAFYGRRDQSRQEAALEIVELPTTLKSIGEYAFFDQKRYADDVVLPEGLEEIGMYCFYRTGLTGVTLPEGIMSIQRDTFRECAAMKHVEIPETVTEIGEEAFYDCISLEKLVLPKSVVQLGKDTNENGVFFGCVSLKEVTLPVELSDTINFHNCSGVEVIHYTLHSTGVMPARNANFYYYHVDNDVRWTMEYASAKVLREVYFEEGIVNISDYTFYGCQMLEKVELPSTLKYIGNYAFYYTSNYIDDLILPAGVEEIGYECFHGSGLTGITLPEGLKKIGSGSFKECTGLTHVEIPKSIIQWGDKDGSYSNGVFSFCSGLKEVTVPVEFSDDKNFYGCSSVEVIHYTKQSTGIMYGRSLYSINQTMENASAGVLREVYFEEGITEIADCAFYVDDDTYAALEKVVLPTTLEWIGHHAFYGQQNLKGELALPEGLSYFGDSCFANSGLISVVMPASLSGFGYDSFDGCPSAFVAKVHRNTTAMYNCIQQGIPYEIIVTYIFTLPASVKQIEEEAFMDSNVEQYVLPEGITGIGSMAFAENSRLVKINLPSTIVSIADDAFYDCGDFTIFCEANSYAETYAIENGFNYVTNSADY